jgi:hypothetical protein
MADVRAAQEAMTRAEQEARMWDAMALISGSAAQQWARDLLRLVERDRAILERHHATGADGLFCAGHGDRHPFLADCADRKVVADFWTSDA